MAPSPGGILRSSCKSRRDPHSDFGSHIETHDFLHAPNGCEKVYLLHNENFWGSEGKPLIQVSWLEMTGKGARAFLLWFGVGLGWEFVCREDALVWIFPLHQSREQPCFLIHFCRCWHKGKGGVRMQSCQKSKPPKMESESSRQWCSK